MRISLFSNFVYYGTNDDGQLRSSPIWADCYPRPIFNSSWYSNIPFPGEGSTTVSAALHEIMVFL